MGKRKDLRTKSEIKFTPTRQQRKRTADGDTKRVISVKDDDTRCVIHSQDVANAEDTRLVVLSSTAEGEQAAPEPEVNADDEEAQSAPEPEVDADDEEAQAASEPEYDADDAISVHAVTDDEL